MTLRFVRPVSVAINSILGQAVRVLLLRCLAIMLPTAAHSPGVAWCGRLNWSIQRCRNFANHVLLRACRLILAFPYPHRLATPLSRLRLPSESDIE